MADSSPLIAKQALVGGKASTLTFSAGGRMEWRGRSGGCLSVDGDVLGYAAEGSALRIRAYVKNSGGGCCGHKEIVRKQRDVVLEPSSEELLGLWCERLRQCVDSIGQHQRSSKTKLLHCLLLLLLNILLKQGALIW